MPQILDFDEQSGAIVYEDLGDCLLYDIVVRDGEGDTVREFYQEAVEILAALQVNGKNGFNKEFCWDTTHYDRHLMLERESGYFMEEFCQKYARVTGEPDKLDREFEELADRIERQSVSYLMHRDYQSRNLMITPKGLRVIDFQGARFGPLGYDLASLLNDPYVNLTENFKKDLLNHYLLCLDRHISLDREAFTEEYYHIALQRNLQVLGAYAFLSQERGKVFFRQFMPPALTNLAGLLEGPLAGEYPALSSLTAELMESEEIVFNP